jgi:AAA ATPase domain
VVISSPDDDSTYQRPPKAFRPCPFVSRRTERAALDRLLEEARLGQSGALVVRGEAGIGKTALLEYAAGRAEGCRVLRAVGVESEMELPFAGFTSCVRRCSPGSSGCRRLSVRRSGPRLA